MRDGDPEGLLHGLKIAATVLDGSVGRLKIQNLVIYFFLLMISCPASVKFHGLWT